MLKESPVLYDLASAIYTGAMELGSLEEQQAALLTPKPALRSAAAHYNSSTSLATTTTTTSRPHLPPISQSRKDLG